MLYLLSSFYPVFPRIRGWPDAPYLAAMFFTPLLHFFLSNASSCVRPILRLSSSTCDFHIAFGRPRRLLPSTWKSNALLKTSHSSLLKTCPYHLTAFALAKRSIVSLNPSNSISSSLFFLSVNSPHNQESLIYIF